METDKDHIHILLEYDATERIFWSDGYFACNIGEVSSAIIEKYITEQG